ncbi:hypothetical protein HPB50_007007 [Hyalomma asiaticum]|uniref:Uncharacterized protein n=1 Tax=Hyalomma asiaticum TaxID=266040 RepID=A0ACB7SKW0_HYAAI|nr:hypothetical protein HPB50_007007 [Hyalomma asiaticum]
MIATRKEAMFLIGMHLVPNIFGVARFSYGFHRTVSPVGGLILDVWHGGECVANICIDAGMILLLWREVVMTRLLGLFVVWNTLSMLFCCGANIAGLRYPPKWTRLVIFWAPVIIGFSFAKVFHVGGPSYRWENESSIVAVGSSLEYQSGPGPIYTSSMGHMISTSSSSFTLPSTGGRAGWKERRGWSSRSVVRATMLREKVLMATLESSKIVEKPVTAARAIAASSASIASGAQLKPSDRAYRIVAGITRGVLGRIYLSRFQLYYTSLLYEFYKIYKSTGGKAYDGQGLARIACSGRTSKARTPAVAMVEGQAPAGLSPLPQQGGAITAAVTPASAGHTPSVYSQMHSAIAQGGGGTAAQSAIASSVTTPRPATAPSSAVMTPKPTDGASVVPRTAAQEGVAVAVETKPKSRTTRSKKQPGTADARNAAAGKLYYTSLLYEFYKIYKSTGGKAYDGQGLARIACSGRTSKARTPAVAMVEGQAPAGLSPVPQQGGAITAAVTPASAGHTPSVYSQMHSAIAQGGGGTAAQSAIASSVTTPRPATAPSSAVMTPKPTDGASVVPHTAAQEGVAVAVETKPKSRTTRSKKQPGTADARNAAAGKVTPKTPGDRARQL